MYTILNGGTYTRHNGNFIMNRPNGFPHYVLVIIKSSALVILSGKEYRVSPGTAFIIDPGTPYFCSNPDGDYVNDWLHFDHPRFSEEYSQLINLPFRTEHASVISNLIEQILWENGYGSTNYKESHIDMLFTMIMDTLNESYHAAADLTYSPYLYALQHLRLSNASNPVTAPNAEEAASQLGISLSYFEHLYSDYFKTPYGKDLIQMRIEYAKELLSTTDLTISVVAAECGYANDIHFYRQFKELVAITPAAYRKKYASSTPESFHRR